ncbi:MAG TPA: divalent-cation tolerance protein CutA [Bryobacteraceae bacterium]|nr:divalent-cation tolerance protein CutA [Bryobacteraceae bacterium]
MSEKIIVFSNCGSQEQAQRVARALVDTHVCACVNIVPGIQSIYRWQGSVQEEAEWMLIIKTRRELFEQLSVELRKNHSYEIPEVIAIPIIEGSPDYLDWIDRETVGSANF